TVVNKKEADAPILMGVRIEVCPAVDKKEVRPLCAYHKALLAVDHKMIPFENSLGSSPEEVGAAPGFRQCLGCNELAFEVGFEITLFLIISAEPVEGLAHYGRHDKGAPKCHAQAPDLFLSSHLGDPAHLPAAILLGKSDSSQVVPGKFFHKLAGVDDLISIHPP